MAASSAGWAERLARAHELEEVTFSKAVTAIKAALESAAEQYVDHPVKGHDRGPLKEKLFREQLKETLARAGVKDLPFTREQLTIALGTPFGNARNKVKNAVAKGNTARTSGNSSRDSSMAQKAQARRRKDQKPLDDARKRKEAGRMNNDDSIGAAQDIEQEEPHLDTVRSASPLHRMNVKHGSPRSSALREDKQQLGSDCDMGEDYKPAKAGAATRRAKHKTQIGPPAGYSQQLHSPSTSAASKRSLSDCDERADVDCLARTKIPKLEDYFFFTKWCGDSGKLLPGVITSTLLASLPATYEKLKKKVPGEKPPGWQDDFDLAAWSDGATNPLILQQTAAYRLWQRAQERGQGSILYAYRKVKSETDSYEYQRACAAVLGAAKKEADISVESPAMRSIEHAGPLFGQRSVSLRLRATPGLGRDSPFNGIQLSPTKLDLDQEKVHHPSLPQQGGPTSSPGFLQGTMSRSASQSINDLATSPQSGEEPSQGNSDGINESLDHDASALLDRIGEALGGGEIGSPDAAETSVSAPEQSSPPKIASNTTSLVVEDDMHRGPESRDTLDAEEPATGKHDAAQTPFDMGLLDGQREEQQRADSMLLREADSRPISTALPDTSSQEIARLAQSLIGSSDQATEQSANDPPPLGSTTPSSTPSASTSSSVALPSSTSVSESRPPPQYSPAPDELINTDGDVESCRRGSVALENVQGESNTAPVVDLTLDATSEGAGPGADLTPHIAMPQPNAVSAVQDLTVDSPSPEQSDKAETIRLLKSYVTSDKKGSADESKSHSEELRALRQHEDAELVAHYRRFIDPHHATQSDPESVAHLGPEHAEQPLLLGAKRGLIWTQEKPNEHQVFQAFFMISRAARHSCETKLTSSCGMKLYRTNGGLIASEPGTGKTAVMLIIITMNLLFFANVKDIIANPGSHMGHDQASSSRCADPFRFGMACLCQPEYRYLQKSIYVDPCVVLQPHHTIVQWQKELTRSINTKKVKELSGMDLTLFTAHSSGKFTKNWRTHGWQYRGRPYSLEELAEKHRISTDEVQQRILFEGGRGLSRGLIQVEAPHVIILSSAGTFHHIHDRENEATVWPEFKYTFQCKGATCPFRSCDKKKKDRRHTMSPQSDKMASLACGQIFLDESHDNLGGGTAMIAKLQGYFAKLKVGRRLPPRIVQSTGTPILENRLGPVILFRLQYDEDWISNETLHPLWTSDNTALICEIEQWRAKLVTSPNATGKAAALAEIFKKLGRTGPQDHAGREQLFSDYKKKISSLAVKWLKQFAIRVTRDDAAENERLPPAVHEIVDCEIEEPHRARVWRFMKKWALLRKQEEQQQAALTSDQATTAESSDDELATTEESLDNQPAALDDELATTEESLDNRPAALDDELATTEEPLDNQQAAIDDEGDATGDAPETVSRVARVCLSIPWFAEFMDKPAHELDERYDEYREPSNRHRLMLALVIKEKLWWANPSSCPLWKDIPAIVQSSSKIQWLIGRIKARKMDRQFTTRWYGPDESSHRWVTTAPDKMIIASYEAFPALCALLAMQHPDCGLNIEHDRIGNLRSDHVKRDKITAGFSHQPLDLTRNEPEPRIDFIILNTKGGNNGLNLQQCHETVLLDVDTNCTRNVQLEGRTLRTGQEHECLFFHLVANLAGIERAWAEGRDLAIAAASKMLDGKGV